MTTQRDEEPFGRQPGPVRLTFEGDQRDVDYYLERLRSMVEYQSYDVCTRPAPCMLVIHPHAVND